MKRTSLHTYVEKFLSMILRHSPETISIFMSSDGWVNVEQLLINTNESKNLENVVLTKNFLDEVVLLSPKQRFTYSSDGLYIRANQGHSLKDIQIDFEEVTSMNTLYHGTTHANINSIKEKGLLKMNRNYVHLSPSVDIAIEVGKRYGKVVVFEVNINKMLLDGYKLYKSKNNVYLVDTVPCEYLTIFSQKITNYNLNLCYN